MTVLDEKTVAAVPLRRNRDFLLLWTGNWLQFFGSRMSGVCYPLLALQVSGGSARAVGFASAAAVLPYAVVQLPAGVLVDRWDRRRVMQVCAVGRTAVLAAVAAMVLLDVLGIGALLALIAADVSLAIVSSLAERAAVRTVVPDRQLPSALAQNEARGRIAGLLGGPAGTVLFTWSRWSPYLAAAFGAVVAAVNVRLIRADCRPAAAEGRRRIREDLSEGLAWVRTQPVLRSALPLVALATGLLQVVSLALVVVLVKEEGHAESTVGLLLGISGCGGVLGALSARWWMARLPMPALLVGGFTLWAVLMGGMSAASGPVALGLLFGAMNLIGAVFGVATAVYQMTTTPDRLQGRVAALAGLVTAAGATVGAFGGGWLLETFDGARSLRFTAVAMAVVALSTGLVPSVRRARIPTAEPTADTPADPSADAPDPESRGGAPA
ncbi:MFS transporter [Streptomyces sp. NRRL B-24572]|uniref:MFS transporter n=1 Tax=Streptomyces sp. NRRL B-24572 TaxID=1962156 RepID=UPI000A377F5B|nr:MFS transporter [Streptomyces sp. NRRL B-24572]